MTYNFTFTTRDEYLAYRADWRARYKAQTQEIRLIKRQMVERYTKGFNNSSYQSNLHYLRRRANEMMVELQEAKEFKNKQMAEAIAEAA